ncbi:alkaline phosphatase family protein [Nocardia sp. NPDC049149]|uniref:alkaline phosphatase family protein n=1 Tax=Nocardia sp. NPDC049149 TaxID=3364315 RepID=UPI00371F2C15
MSKSLSKAVVAVAASLIATTALGPVAQADASVNKVVVIGLDGTMYAKIKETNVPNLKKLSADGALSQYSIRPHTTISGPSWSSVLTGVWDTKHGVKDNNFDETPFTKWPSVFTRLEKAQPQLNTAAIATWSKIATIAGSGNPHADVVVTTPPVPGDSNESKTDTATADAAVAAIGKGTDFLFTHLDQVDEAGHECGRVCQKYADAIRRVDVEVGKIVAAVDKRAASKPNEKWTIMVTTDHGHRTLGGHGGQSDAETSSFLIARGPDFKAGPTGGAYTFVDIVPTVLQLFGAPPADNLDGKSMIGRLVSAAPEDLSGESLTD